MMFLSKIRRRSATVFGLLSLSLACLFLGWKHLLVFSAPPSVEEIFSLFFEIQEHLNEVELEKLYTSLPEKTQKKLEDRSQDLLLPSAVLDMKGFDASFTVTRAKGAEIILFSGVLPSRTWRQEVYDSFGPYLQKRLARKLPSQEVTEDDETRTEFRFDAGIAAVSMNNKEEEVKIIFIRKIPIISKP